MRNFFLSIFLGGVTINLSLAQVADNQLLKAGMLVEKKQFSEAAEAIKLSASTTNKHYTKIQAQIYFGLGNYAAAAQLFSNLEQETPGTYQLELARCAGMEGNMAKSMDYLNQYFKSKNKLPISKIINDNAFKNFRGNATWENLWQKIDYSEPELKVNQITSAAESGDLQYLGSSLDDALRKYPNNPELLYYQSKLFLGEKMYNAAERSIEQALEAKPNNDKYYYQQSLIQQKKNSPKNALLSINEAIQRNPFNLNYYSLRIDINKSLGNSKEINEDLELLQYCLPNDPDVQFSRIKTEADKGNYINAIGSLSDLIENDKTNSEYYILRGKLKLKTQKLQDADEDFGMALDLKPSDAEANFGKGMAKHELGDKQAACYYWQKAVNEGSREALEYLNKYCSK